MITIEHSRSIKFLANNLTVLEILQQINKHISSKVPVETDVQEPITKKKQKKR